jgi:alpha-L-arabinofuranosidase
MSLMRVYPMTCRNICRPGFLGLISGFALLTCLMAIFFIGKAGAVDPVATITVQAGDRLHTLNPLLFGQNILFASNNLWNHRVNGIDPAARPLVKPLAPTLVRFPGGTASNIYLWEDGLGFRTTTEVKPYTSAITLNGTPDWQTVRQARIYQNGADPMGRPFTFMHLKGNQLGGVIDLKAAYPAGVMIRPDARAGQPDYFINNYGIMEHMQFAQALGAEAILVVNYNTGLDGQGRLTNQVSLSQKIKRAAAWVAFVNGSPDDGRELGKDEEGHNWHTVGYWAQKRAALGHPAPYRVKYWEIGNEMYDKNNEGGFVTAQRYGEDFKAFAGAMRGVDPTLKLGAVGLSDPRGHGDADFTDLWNPTVVQIAGQSMDFLVLHAYYPAAGPKPAPYRSQAWYAAVMAGATQALGDIREVRKVIQENAPPGKNISIALTEYGIWPAEAKDPRDWSNLARALFDADFLMDLLKEGPGLGVNLATDWIMYGSTPSAAIHYNWTSGTRTLRPQYYAMELLRKLAPVMVKTQVTSPTFSVQQVGNVKAASDIPEIGALASPSKDGNTLTVLVINRALAAPATAAIRLMDFTPQACAQVFKVTSPRLSDQNEDRAQTVTLTSGALNDAAPQFTYTLDPHSLTLFQFQAAPH